MHHAPLSVLFAGLASLAAASSPASAQVCGTTLDLNTQPAPKPTRIDQGRFPSQEFPGSFLDERAYDSLVELGGAHYFAGTNLELGTELYRTDGTALGTFLVDDTTPGPNSTGPCMLTPYLGDLFFVDSDNPTRQLYRMSSTTGIVSSLGVVGDSDNDFGDARMVVVGGKLVFIGKDAAEGYELWSSDGTAAGTGMLKALSPGAGSSQIRHLLANASGTFAVFLVEDDAGVRSVWVTDGTTVGTQQLQATQSIATNQDSVPAWTARFGDDIVYARVGAQGAELVRTDGATTQVLGTPGISIDLSHATLYNGELYFTARSAASGEEVWRTDGTPGGTQLAIDVVPGPSPSQPASYAVANGKLFFVARTSALGRELLVWDGATSATLDVNPGPVSAFLSIPELGQEVVPAGGGVLFRAYEASVGTELFFSDGTQAGTMLIADLDTQGSSEPHVLTPRASGDVLFAATPASGAAGIYRFDGQGVALVEALTGSVGTMSSGIKGLRRVAPSVVLAEADLGQSGTTANSVVRVSPFGGVEEIVKGGDYVLVSMPWPGGAADRGKFFFVGAPQQGEVHLYVSEGVPGVVHQLPDLVPNPLVYLAHWMGNTENGLVLATTGIDLGFGSVVSGVFAVTDDNSALIPLGSVDNAPPVELDGELVFAAPFGSLGMSVMVTDGTLAGTVPILDWPAPVSGATDIRLGKAGARATFIVDRFQTQTEIGVTDGTLAGTQVAALGALDIDLSVEPAGFADEVYFVADDGVLGRELYAFDVTNGQVRLVADVLPGAAGSAPVRLTEVADGIVFATSTAAGDLEFFHTDGTATGQVSNLGATTPAHAVGGLVAAPEAVYATVELENGIGLVAIAASTTTLLCDDFVPGSQAPGLMLYDGGLLTVVDDPLLGTELKYVGLGAARAQTFGDGATLTATAPNLGATSIVRSTAGPAPFVSALAFSGSVTWPLEVPALASELLWLDPNGFQIAGLFAGGNWAYPAAVPSDPALLGAHITLQALYLGAAFPGELSNPVALTLGL